MSFFQIQLSPPPAPTGFSGGLPSVDFATVLTTGGIVFGAGLVILLLMLGVRRLLRSRRFLPEALQETILLVMVPRESSSEAAKTENLDETRSQIGVAESWLSTLGAMRKPRGLRTWLWGRHDQFSLELVSQNGLISFYVAVPAYLRHFMEQQILAQYPEAQITEVIDYNMFSARGEVLGCYLKTNADPALPLNTYVHLNSDPLQSLTNSLSGIAPADGVAIQIIVRPAHKAWRSRSSKIARALHEGKTLRESISAQRGWNVFQTKKKDELQKPQRQTTPLEQRQVEGIEQKASKAGFDCNIRVVVSAGDQTIARRYLDSIVNSFGQFTFYQYGNSLRAVSSKSSKLVEDFIFRVYDPSLRMLLNTEELASIFHFPTPFLDTPNIRWLLARKLSAPSNTPREGLLIGENIYRGVKTNVCIQPDDRARHMYVIGMTGTGKSVLLQNMAIQDIRNGHGVCVIDPHGSLVESIMEFIPRERIDDVIYFNPTDTERPIGLNMLEAQLPEQQDFAVQEMIAIFYKLVTDPSMIGPVFEHNMRNAMLTLMADPEQPGTIAEIPRMFTDTAYQRSRVAKVQDPMVRSFWEQEMAKTSDFHKSETLGYLISKVGRFIENRMIRNIIGQAHSGFDFRKVMDEQKILLVNLSKGTVGEVNSNLLGLILVSKLQMAALSRANMPEAQRKDFYLYVDEFQNFITDSISTILAEARKYKLNLILAHQYLGQLTSGGVEGKGYGDKIKDAIFGNVGTLAAFRIGTEDAELIAKQFAPAVSEYDLSNIERFQAYVRLLVDNQPVRAFNIKTFPPQIGEPSIADDVRQFSRWKYGQDIRVVEKEILDRGQLGASSTPPPVEKTL